MSSSLSSLNVIRAGYRMLVESGGFDRVLDGVKILAAESGKLSAEFVVAKEHTNRGGFLHGGFTCTLVDQMSTMALFTYGTGEGESGTITAGVSVDISVSYMAPANLGDTVLVEATTLKRGKNMAYLNVDLFNKKDMKLIARGNHIKYIGTTGTAKL